MLKDIISQLPQELAELLGPPLPAEAFDAGSAASGISNFFFDPRLQWDADGNMLKDPRGDTMPDNLWTQFVAVQATLIKRLNEAIAALGIQQSFGVAVIFYTLAIRTALYPLVRGQLETTAKVQVLAPRVNELKEKYKDDKDRLNMEVGTLYMDLQIDPLGAIFPVLLQLPIFWGLYRGIRRLAIVEYEPIKQQFLWIPNLFGPSFSPDPNFNWLTQWQGPLIDLHPKIGWETFGLYTILPAAVFLSYKQVLSAATEDENSPKILQIFPFFLAFICCELPSAMGIYIATNIASSVALTAITKEQIQSQIPGYREFVETGKWPPGVDPEKVLAKAFGVKRLTGDAFDLEDPVTIAEAVFSGRADFIPELLTQGRKIDDFDDRGIPASAYCLALDNPDLLDRLFTLGASPTVLDKKGNSLLHYLAGYGRASFLPSLLEKGLDKMLDHTNEDGQTALDVARTNLSQEKVANRVREVIKVLNEAGANGKLTTLADEERFEQAREQKKRQQNVQAARQALMAMAAQSKKAEEAKAEEAKAAEADAKADAEADAEAKAEESSGSNFLVDSLDRVKALDLDSLKKRLGDSMTEEQVQRVMERLKTMSPEELAAYASGMKGYKDAAAQPKEEEDAEAGDASSAHEVSAKESPVSVAPEPAPPAAAPKKQSVIVD